MTDTNNKLKQAKVEGKISDSTFENIASWLANDQVRQFHDQITKLIDQANWSELNDAFYTNIEFGTAGIRGKTGFGSARINAWTVGTATQGLADYLNSLGPEATSQGVVVGSDTRLTSPGFVKLVTTILTGNGIKVYGFPGPRQVGMISFAIRLHQAQAGVYISASHNPPLDNGLKIYWADGAQVLPPHDKAITEAVKHVKRINEEVLKTAPIIVLDEDFDDAYRARVLHESVSQSRSAKIVYSPFHGTGQYGVLPILRDAGFEVTTVKEQMAPDGHFPHVPGGVPNPENRESNALTAQKVLATGADLGISTDPDADRLGLIVPRGGDTVILDGNQTMTLLAYFIADRLKTEGKLPRNGFLVRTLVTTSIIDAIAADFGLECYQTLVGFKYIGELIRDKEDLGNELFIFGGEESFGCLKGSYAHDKDASVAALLAAELVSHLKDQGQTVWDLFATIYRRYGYYHNDLINIKYEGAEGFATMSKLMDNLRSKPPRAIGKWPVLRTIDRLTNETKDAEGRVIERIDGHTTNMLIFNLSADGRSSVTIRPSGTEPKVKAYIALANDKAKEADYLESVISETKTQAEELKNILKKINPDMPDSGL